MYTPNITFYKFTKEKYVKLFDLPWGIMGSDGTSSEYHKTIYQVSNFNFIIITG